MPTNPTGKLQHALRSPRETLDDARYARGVLLDAIEALPKDFNKDPRDHLLRGAMELTMAVVARQPTTDADLRRLQQIARLALLAFAAVELPDPH